MNFETLPLWSALLAQLGLGIVVFRANNRSRNNQAFLLVSLFIAGWLLCLQFAFNAVDPVKAAQWIRHASMCGILMVNGFNILRLAIVCREGGWREILRRSVLLGFLSAAAIGVCYAPSFITGVQVRSGGTPEGLVPRPIYGPLFPVFAGFLFSAFVAVIILYVQAIRRSTGIRKVELQFVVAGGIAMGLMSVMALLLQPVLPRAAIVRLAPFRVVIFSLVIAYGISTRKIMNVGVFVRRVAAYTVLTAYLLALYGIVWFIVVVAFEPLLREERRQLAHIAAALAVSFAMAPARGVSQSFANRLFIGTRGLDFRSTVNKATAILRSVVTLRELLERFGKTIGEAIDTERVVILLPTKVGYAQHYPSATEPEHGPISFGKDQAVIAHLETHPEPIVLDELHRIRATPELTRVTRQMESLTMAVAMGIYSREHLAGVMLLGPRRSGQIYGSVEQNALQVLCGQLAVAIDNAQLFTEVQNARIYNEILLQNLTTGVIAASAEKIVTVFNNEAEQITGLRAQDLIDKPVLSLPDAIREVVEETLRTGERQENRELFLDSNAGTVIARASSSVFRGQDGQQLGALMVLTDITALKRLEMQIRRSDRLASLGTLSAGMAHEIKNPLVSIKTFAQLLPERYQDSDFRETFSTLIGHEIDRIDSLVNQLLRFARPAKPLLRPMHVHEVLEKSLMLVGHRLYQKEIKLSRSWNAELDTIRADADQIEQVFLNFFLNAMDAMKHGGELTVATEIGTASDWPSPVSGMNGHISEVLCVTVRDNGEGIKSEDIAHVFDPFFTTKDYGTGLGLSVVHGIIQEHGGQIEVESEVARGTAFHILLPLVRLEEEVAAA